MFARRRFGALALRLMRAIGEIEPFFRKVDQVALSAKVAARLARFTVRAALSL
jgi:hypothetical protein